MWLQLFASRPVASRACAVSPTPGDTAYSGALAFEGFASEAELADLLGALTDEERAEYAAERRSRERLCAIVRAAAEAGPVYVYACWAGDESEPHVAEERCDPGWLVERTAPLEERVRYLVTVERARWAAAPPTS